MKKNLLFAVVLFLSLVGVISCKNNKEDASGTVTARLQSYKTEFSLQVWGGSVELSTFCNMMNNNA